MKKTLTSAVVVLASAALLATGCAGEGGGSAKFQDPVAPAGNGVEALEAAQILEKAKAALAQAKSFHMKGTMKSEDGKIGLDFKVAGEELAGSMTMDGPKLEMLAVGGKRYIRPDETFWGLGNTPEKAAQIAATVGDRWVLVPTKNQSFNGMFGATDVGDLLENEGAVTKGKVEQIDGKPAIGLVDGDPEGGTLYIATTGEPYPVRLAGPTPADGALTFSEYGETFADIKAPAAAEVVNLESLTK
ncbi:hypothetical protein JIG36_03055 [Actinoplanes sp. LDG1-06]|uniref:Lipoprotein n=1 Tax=Paractinoplanes ovalisporus TaxID=2810368 RepID=A0ABS2A3V7_9ACTN|nr:hypothetical protein [Actinoplanes ovalisporus]MBM2614532.1 hypothetical protein [Actinoplanes ovalisporus]